MMGILVNLILISLFAILFGIAFAIFAGKAIKGINKIVSEWRWKRAIKKLDYLEKPQIHKNYKVEELIYGNKLVDDAELTLLEDALRKSFEEKKNRWGDDYLKLMI